MPETSYIVQLPPPPTGAIAGAWVPPFAPSRAAATVESTPRPDSDWVTRCLRNEFNGVGQLVDVTA